MAIFEWDEDKARRNRDKHGVTFEDAMLVWQDPFHVVLPDRVEDHELRYHAIGVVGLVTVLLVVHIYVEGDDEHVRIVSARRATPWERGIYEQDLPAL